MFSLLGRVLLSRSAFFVYGTLVGPAINRYYEPAGSVARGLAKSVIKQGIAAGTVIQRAATTAKENIDDIAAEAKSELSQQAHTAAPKADATVAQPGTPV